MSLLTPSGFALIELVVVITILALILAVSPLRNLAVFNRAELGGEAHKLVSQLRYVRGRSLADGQVYSVQLLSEEAGYEVVPDLSTVVLPEGFAISMAAGSQRPDPTLTGLSFYPDGSSNGGTLTIHDGNRQVAVQVNGLTGEVSRD